MEQNIQENKLKDEFVTIEVKGQELKLILDGKALEYAEDLLDKSIAGIFLKMISGMSQEALEKLDNVSEENYMEILGMFNMPRIKELKAIIVASSKRYNHGIKDKDILEELEDTSVFDMFSIVMPLLMNSKIMPRA